jgi:hypothetical protein
VKRSPFSLSSEFVNRKRGKRYFNLHDALTAFHNLFTYESKDDRTIAILGTFLEMR